MIKILGFRNWLLCYVTENTPLGDLARDVCFEDVVLRKNSIKGYRSLLETTKGTIAEDTAKEAWRQYVIYRKYLKDSIKDGASRT